MKCRIAILPPLCLLFAGAALGVLSKMLDIYTTNLGNIFSELSIWILLGTLIAFFSRTKAQACVNILPFCLGMLLAYYVTAQMTGSVYSMHFVYGWAVFSLFSPLFACAAWMAKEPGTLAKILSGCIVLTTLLASIVLFDGPRLYDLLILLALVYLLFFHRVRRPQPPCAHNR